MADQSDEAWRRPSDPDEPAQPETPEAKPAESEPAQSPDLPESTMPSYDNPDPEPTPTTERIVVHPEPLDPSDPLLHSYPPQPGFVGVPRVDNYAISSVGLGLIGLCGAPILCCSSVLTGGLIQLVCGVSAISLGLKARSRISDSQGTLAGDGLAMAGIIIGGLVVLAGFLTTVLGFNKLD